MTNARPNRASLPVLEAAICTLQARDASGGLRSELGFCGLSVLRLAARAYALGVYPPSDARMLCQVVLSLAAALPVNPDDRREPRREPREAQA